MKCAALYNKNIHPGNLSKETEKDSGRNGRAYNAGYVGAHRMHQEMVVRVEFPSYYLRDPCAVR